MKKDLLNQVFGSLTIIKKLDSRVYTQFWLCQCSCGNTIELPTEKLCSSRSKKHCGCQDKKLMLQQGQRFGKLTIIKETKIKYSHRNDPVRAWECLCECGKTTIQETFSLIRGNAISCGCGKGPIYKMELKGQVFGRLTVISVDTSGIKKGNKHWNCKCECGKEVSVATSSLVKEKTKSCGCLFEDRFNDYRVLKGNAPNEPLTIRKRLLRGRLSGTKKNILIKYNNKCQLCQEEYTNQSLIIHHIISMSEDDSKYKQPENLIPLCKKCHYIAHNNNWQQTDLFIQQKLALITGLELK